MSLSSLSELKEQGNRAFAAGKPSAAAAVYTDAIALLSEPVPPDLRTLVSVLFSNRALCHRSLHDWAACETDARKANELDRFNCKAYFLLGTVFLRGGDYAQALRQLESGLEMAKRQRRGAAMQREFEVAIASGRQRWHESSASEEAEADAVLHSFLEAAVEAHWSSAIARSVSSSPPRGDGGMAPIPEGSVRDGGRGAGAAVSVTPPVPRTGAPPLGQPQARRVSVRYDASAQADASVVAGAAPALPGASAGNPAAAVANREAADTSSSSGMGSAARVAMIEAEHEARLAQLHEWAAAREKARRRGEAPAHLVCPITLEVMVDPVVTPGGHSYERAALERSLRMKPEDPSTRAPLHAHQLVPNLALKAAIAAYLAEHPWAHPYLAEGEAAVG